MIFEVEQVANHPVSTTPGYSQRFVVWRHGLWVTCADYHDAPVRTSFRPRWITVQVKEFDTATPEEALYKMFEYLHGEYASSIVLTRDNEVSGEYTIRQRGTGDEQ